MKVFKDYVFFWSGFLSQWESSPFTNSFGVRFNCAEQYMMAYKAEMMQDYAAIEKIMISSDPAEQKKLGRAIANFDAKLWDQYKVAVVIAGNLCKFRQNERLRNQLLNYRTEVFVEASPYDKVWGIGKHIKSITEQDCEPQQWEGQNLLGYSLTYVRDTLLGIQNNPRLPAAFTAYINN